MSDGIRELLELAARAAGIEIGPEYFTDEIGRKYVDSLGLWVRIGKTSHGHWWNPLKDDGDALRLAVALKFEVMPGVYGLGRCDVRNRHGEYFTEQTDNFDGDICAATRFCILRAAAKAGKTMP